MYQNTLYRIIDKLINTLRLNGFKSITYGTEKDIDFSKKDISYPLAHIIMPNGTVNEKTTQLSFIIMVADKLDNMRDNAYPEYGNTNAIDIQQDLIVRTSTALKSLDKRYLTSYDSLEIGYDYQYNATFDVFYEDFPELLSGYIFNMVVSMPNMVDDCQPDPSIPGVPSRPQNYGTSGTDGTSGSSGTNGTDGTDGTSGISGTNGTSGTSGRSGTNGTSGISGTNGTSGTSGTSGSSGTNGTSGTSGTSGSSGTNGTSGSSGVSGTNGTSGTPGSSGTNGTSGTSGSSGTNGTSGSSGVSGTNGWSFNGNTLGDKKTIGSIDNQDFGIITNNTERLTVLKNGNVGIEMTNPNQQLEITKNFRLPTTVGTDAYGVIYKDDNRFIHDFNYGNNGTVTTDGYNTFLGVNAGNFTMGSTASASAHSSYNTGIGMQALYRNTTGSNNSAIGMQSLLNNTTGSNNSAIGVNALRSNTTGSNNSAIGVSVLQNNTTGYYNSAIGANALQNDTTGSNNSAIGVQALYRNTTGSNNSAIGMQALYRNTTGNYNSAIGMYAGRYLPDGKSRETGNNGLYLGYNSKASADGTDNEIVIGADAIGKGSNTIKLGNSSILATYTDGEIYKGKEQSNVQGVVFTQIADKTIGNTTTETTMFATGVGSLTIPANTLVAGRTYRIKLKGYASGTNGDTSTLKVKLGSTELVSSTGTWQTLTDIGFTLEFDFTCRTTGTTGTVAGNGYSLVSGGQGFSTVSMRALLSGADTIDTTSDQIIDLTYQWSSASAGNTITITNASVEVLN